MKIAFIMTTPVVSQRNGVRMQALSWKDGLQKIGHQVDLINIWDNNNWGSYDILHFFCNSSFLYSYIIDLYKINTNIIVSPILDPRPQIGTLIYKIYSHWGSFRLGLKNDYLGLRKLVPLIKMFSVRSEFERRYIAAITGCNLEKIQITPLASRFCGETNEEHFEKKEKFCLHVSLLYDKRKNVERLVAAAKKYQFKLILGGNLKNDIERVWLNNLILNSENIKYVGPLSDEKLKSLYSRAKVFALPSINEGVGLVALEAASFGCNIVITKLGAPREYYAGMAELVNPYSVDDIGESILRALNDNTSQPSLQQHICYNYSIEKTMRNLVHLYTKMINI